MPVPGYQRKVELACYCGDPNVVVRDQPPDPGEFRFHLAVPFAGALIRQQEDGSLQKIADQSQLHFPPLGAERAIVKLAQDHSGQVNRACPGAFGSRVRRFAGSPMNQT